MDRYISPDIQAIKSDFDEFVIEAEDFIKRQKCYGNQDKIQRV